MFCSSGVGTYDHIRDFNPDLVHEDGIPYAFRYGLHYRMVVLGKQPEFLPDSETFARVMEMSDVMFEAYETFFGLQCKLGIIYGGVREKVEKSKVRYLLFEQEKYEPRPPKEDYEVIIRGTTLKKQRLAYFRDMSAMMMIAAAQRRRKEKKLKLESCVEFMSYEQLTKYCVEVAPSPMYTARCADEPDEAREMVACKYVDESVGLQQESRIMECVDAVALLALLPHTETRIILHGQRAFREMILANYPQLTIVKENGLLITDYFYGHGQDMLVKSKETPRRVVGVTRIMVVLQRPLLPSPGCYQSMPSYYGRVHVKNMLMPLIRRRRYQLKSERKILTNFVRGGEVYSVNCSRSYAYMRFLWQMGYLNRASTGYHSPEKDFVFDTSRSVQLVDDIIYEKYEKCVFLDTGQRFSVKLEELTCDRNRRTVTRGTLLVSTSTIYASVPRVKYKFNNGDVVEGYLIMSSVRLKILSGDTMMHVWVVVSGG